MRKILSFLMAVLFAGSLFAAESVIYTLDGTSTGGSSGYAEASNIEQGSITWSVMGNTTMNPWRIGGKNLTEVDREIYSTTPIEANVTKIEVEFGSNTLTVNSWKLIVASDADFKEEIGGFQVVGFEPNTTTTTERPEGADWSNAYYKIVINVSTGTSNQYVQLKSVKFYAEESGEEPPVDEVETPAFSPEGGQFNELVAVTLSVATEGLNIYYAIDDDQNYQLYEDPFTIGTSAVVYAYAVRPADGAKSDVVSAKYEIIEAVEGLVYTLDGTITGGSSAYAEVSTIEQGEITWSVMGNTTMNPWRIGGKNLTEVDREIYSTTPINANVAKIEVEFGTKTLTVNSWKLIVASDEAFENVISTFTPDFEASSTTTIERPEGADWSNAYYKIVINVSTGTSNQYVQFIGARFYTGEGGDVPPVVLTERDQLEAYVAEFTLISTFMKTYGMETEAAEIDGILLQAQNALDNNLESKYSTYIGLAQSAENSFYQEAENALENEITNLAVDGDAESCSLCAEIINGAVATVQEWPYWSSLETLRANLEQILKDAAAIIEETEGYLNEARQQGSVPQVSLYIDYSVDQSNNWLSMPLSPSSDGTTAAWSGTFAAGLYNFKMIEGGDWYGLDGDGDSQYWFTRENSSASFTGNSSRNMIFMADNDPEDTYTFVWTYATKTLTVEYPAPLLNCAQVYGVEDNEAVKMDYLWVTGISGRYVWVQDQDGALMLYLPKNATYEWEVGDQLIGIAGTKTTYNGTVELSMSQEQINAAVKNGTHSLVPVELAEVTLDDINKLVLLPSVTLAGDQDDAFEDAKKNISFKLGDNTVVVRNEFLKNQEFKVGKKYNIMGIVAYYVTQSASTLQVYFISAEEVGGEDPAKVVFTVNVPAGTETVYIAGSFNDWTFDQMEAVAGAANQFTLTVTGDFEIESLAYKYLAGPAWTYGEVDAEGKDAQNRTYSELDEVIGWAHVPGEGSYTNPVFTVNVPAGTEKVYIAGSFNNWGFTEMTAVESVANQFTLTLDGEFDALSYKYLAGPDWNYVEVDAEGNETANRSYNGEIDEVARWWNVPAVETITCAEVYNLASGAAVALKEVVVTYRHSSFAYVRDASGEAQGGMLLYLNTETQQTCEWKAGDRLIGVTGTVEVYNNLYEITMTDDQFALITVQEDYAPQAFLVENMTSDEINQYIVIEHVKLEGMFYETGTSTTITSTAPVEINFFNKFHLAATFEEGKSYTIFGVGSIYKGTLQVNFIEAVEEELSGYFVVGSFNEWTPSEAYRLDYNQDQPAYMEWKLSDLKLTEGDQLKVISVVPGEENIWFPASEEGNNHNFIVESTDVYNIYFREDGQGGDDWFDGYIYAELQETPGVEPVTCAEVYDMQKNDVVDLLNDVTVTYANGKNVWVRDETASMLIYLSAASEAYYAGLVLAGIAGTVDVYNGVHEVKMTAEQEQAVVVYETNAPEAIQLSTVEAADVNKYIVLPEIAFEEDTAFVAETQKNITMNGVVVRNQFKNGYEFKAGKKYNIYGVVTIYQNNPQVYFITAEEVGGDQPEIDPENIIVYFVNKLDWKEVRAWVFMWWDNVRYYLDGKEESVPMIPLRQPNGAPAKVKAVKMEGADIYYLEFSKSFTHIQFIDGASDVATNEVLVEPNMYFVPNDSPVSEGIYDGQWTDGDPTAIGNINVESNEATKVLQNGNIFIIKNGHIYNITGQIVK